MSLEPLLRGTLSPDGQTRAAAEQRIHQLSQTTGFANALLETLLTKTVVAPIR
jgi:hypothetical protein